MKYYEMCLHFVSLGGCYKLDQDTGLYKFNKYYDFKSENEELLFAITDLGNN